jgi:hypothetical protein
MSITKPPVLPAWADTGDKTQPSNGEIETGWPSSAIPPSRQRFNWILNFCANAVRYFCRKGIPEWDAGETYDLYSRVMGSDGYIYKSKVAANINHDPISSPTQWSGKKLLNSFVHPTNEPTTVSYIDSSLTLTNGATYETPVQTLTLSGAPSGSSLVLLRVRTNMNNAGNGVNQIYFRKNPTSPWVKKMEVDPLTHPSMGDFSEPEGFTTFPFEFNDPDNTVQWKFTWNPTASAAVLSVPSVTAQLYIEITPEAYWVPIFIQEG